MIRIQLPQSIPKILQSTGTKENQNNCDLYNNDSASYDKGTKKFNFMSNIYGQSSVKDSLKNAQHKKCCYCESIFVDTSYGAVEHYRPKGAVIQDESQKKIYPGYYWLAYEWNNLLFICSRCNTNKGAYFPLEDNSQRARNHTQSLTNESPLLLNPVVDNPSQHLDFHDDAIFGLTVKGKTTIKYLKLDRNELFESRKEVLDIFKQLVNTAQLFYANTIHQDHYNDALTLIKKYFCVSSKYSAMTNAYFIKFSQLPAFTGI
ncbi:hypothetical protein [Nitrosomonas sp. Is37]|uniref:hypothetical protein n=1 Tax=Nitrosomonas sp. Is37 TaxID=3080535 RepID=UPI00294B5FF4|nr:hypothetical protein [Nitrosomonas sp. Is37]MDV6345714.1 hypothetical protein [Nitrosomonas sp. Is37]